jgi:hypothetical protein
MPGDVIQYAYTIWFANGSSRIVMAESEVILDNCLYLLKVDGRLGKKIAFSLHNILSFEVDK